VALIAAPLRLEWRRVGIGGPAVSPLASGAICSWGVAGWPPVGWNYAGALVNGSLRGAASSLMLIGGIAGVLALFGFSVAEHGGLELRNVAVNYPFESRTDLGGSSRILAAETIRV
jgi:hypothetical protein